MKGLFTLVCILVLSLLLVTNAFAQVSLAPRYTLFANGEYALSVDCVGGELRLWQGADKQSGILFCDGLTETPTPEAMYTAQPLLGGVTTLTPVGTESSQHRYYYFPFMVVR